MMTQPMGSYAAGVMRLERGTNPTDSGAPFYDVYECSDGQWITLAAVEKKFYAEALSILELEEWLEFQWDRDRWPDAKTAIASKFVQRTRDQWCKLFEGREACFAPVLDLAEAPLHPHHQARGTYLEVDEIPQPAPAPRFSRTPAAIPKPRGAWSIDQTHNVLANWLESSRIDKALSSGLLKVSQPPT
jgi:alpha-methylacyl-CoA racemase